MRKLVSLSLAAALLIGVAAAQQNYEEFYDEYRDSVVAIEVSNGNSSVGTGFVHNNYVVTSNHVITDDNEVYPEINLGFNGTGEENLTPAEVVGRDESTDLAVLEPENREINREGLQIANSNPEPGQRVIVIGNAYGMDSTITHGIVSGVNRTPITDEGTVIQNAIQIDAPVNPGDSGGPLMTENGTVLGVVNSRIGDNIGFAVHYTTLEEEFPELIS